MRKPDDMLKDCLGVLEDYIEAVGGCDHDIGICICHLIQLCDEIDEYLTLVSVTGEDEGGGK
jgi:hypothetical protein